MLNMPVLFFKRLKQHAQLAFFFRSCIILGSGLFIFSRGAVRSACALFLLSISGKFPMLTATISYTYIMVFFGTAT